MSTSPAIVLVVDDDETLLSFLGRGLARYGYRAELARSGREALRLLAEQPIAVALTDVMMPEMDGIELLRAIRARQPDLPVVAMTGADHAMHGPLALLLHALGAHAVLSKPFALDTLIATLRHALARVSHTP